MDEAIAALVKEKKVSKQLKHKVEELTMKFMDLEVEFEIL